MMGWTKGLYSFNEARIAMGQLPLDEEWANKYYLVGSKNDSLLPIQDAIGKEPSQGTEVANPKTTNEPGSHTPTE